MCVFFLMLHIDEILPHAFNRFVWFFVVLRLIFLSQQEKKNYYSFRHDFFLFLEYFSRDNGFVFLLKKTHTNLVRKE